MHHALQIPEMVANIFYYCSPADMYECPNTYPRHQATTDLVALARTCHAFKEPALDLLWRDLEDLAPLVRCIPTAFRRSRSTDNEPEYSFIRSLTQAEWDVFRSYARRIRSVLFFDDLLDWESVATFLNPPTTDPLLPNLRTLHCEYADPTMSLLCWPFPSLVDLDIRFKDEAVAQVALESFSKYSPSITKLYFWGGDATQPLKINPEYIWRWQNLRSVILPNVALDVDALVHLSRLPTLTTLRFILDVTLPTSDPSLVFQNLQSLELVSEFLHLISQVLTQTRPPVLDGFYAVIRNGPSRQELLSFFAAFHASDSRHTIDILGLEQSPTENIHAPEEAIILDLEILQPCMAFRHLREVKLDVQCDVALTSNQLLLLASAWPKLEGLAINDSWGWNSTGGITPCGLVQLLRACRLLQWIALRFDTRGYTKVPTQTSRTLENLEFKLDKVYVLDSTLEAQSVVAITMFFCELGTSSKSPLSLQTWDEGRLRDFPDMDEHENRWHDVSHRVEDVVKRHFGYYGDTYSEAESSE